MGRPGNGEIKGKKDDGINVIFVLVAVGVVVFLGTALGAVLVMYKNQMDKAKKAQAAMENAMQSRYTPGVQPMDGDSNVVVGRPVAGPDSAAASSGAVVQAAEDDD